MAATTLTPRTRPGARHRLDRKHASERAVFCRTHHRAFGLVSAHEPDARIGGSRFLQVDPIEGGCANDYVYPADPINNFDLDGTMQRCSNANDATGFGGAGLATLISQGHGKYNLQITLFDHFLAQFSATTFSTGYSVGYSVNGRTARGQFAGDGKFRPAYDDIHSRQVVLGRKYRDRGLWSRKQHTIRSGDILRLKININYYDPVSFRSFSVRGSLTCQV